MEIAARRSPIRTSSIPHSRASTDVTAFVKEGFLGNREIGLVVVMRSVNLWKPAQTFLPGAVSKPMLARYFVKTEENSGGSASKPTKRPALCRSVNRFSAPFAILVHSFSIGWLSRLAQTARRCGYFAEQMWKRGPFCLGRVPHEAGLRVLLQGVHQPGNGPVQIFVRPAQLLDFVDRVQHRSVMLAAELTANLG